MQEDFEARIAESSMLIRPLMQLLPLGLRHLALSQCVEADKEALQDLSRLVSLRSLTLEDCSSACLDPDVTKDWAGMTSFEALTFRHLMSEQLPLKQVLQAFEALPSLACLSIRSQHEFVLDGSPLGVLASFRNLRVLELGTASDQAITLSRSDLNTLGGLPLLEELHLDLYFKLRSDARSAAATTACSSAPSPPAAAPDCLTLPSGPRLILRLHSATLGFWPGGAPDLSIMLSLLSDVRSLLSRCPPAADDGDDDNAHEQSLCMIAHLGHLSELRVTYPGATPTPAALSDDVLASWAASLSELCILELNHTAYPVPGEDPVQYGFALVTNEGLAEIAVGAPRLHTLRLSGLHGVTPHVLLPLAQKGSMRSVEATNCCQLDVHDGRLVTRLVSSLVRHPVSVHVL